MNFVFDIFPNAISPAPDMESNNDYVRSSKLFSLFVW